MQIPYRLVLILVVSALLLIAVGPRKAAADGTQTGNLAGTVVDAELSPVPGVQITLEGPDGRRGALTDETGRFRFPALRPGGYDVSAQLLSLQDRRDGVAVYVGRTTRVDLKLDEAEGGNAVDPAAVLSGPSESVQVVALAPLVDSQDTRVRSVVRREFLDVLPVERFYQSVALLLPDVGGGQDGNPNVGGALRSNNLFLIDGVDTTDAVTGLFGLNLAYEAVESVEVVTAGMPAELGRVSGAVINVVTRTGDGRHRGTARWQVEPSSGRSDYASRPGSETLALDIDAANQGSGDDQTSAVTLSGPLFANRAWYFAAGQDGESTLSRPTLAGDFWDAGVAVESALFRFGGRIGESHTIEGQYAVDSAASLAFSPLLDAAENTTGKPATSAFDALIVPIAGDLAAISRLRQSGHFEKIDWTGVLGPSWTASASIALQDRTLRRDPGRRTGLTGDAVHADITRLGPNFDEVELDDVFDELTIYNGLTDVGRETRPRRQGGFALSWFKSGDKVDHDLRLGLDIQYSESERNLRFSGLEGVDQETGQPVTSQLFLDLGLSEECLAGGRCSSFDPAQGTFSPFLLFNIPDIPGSRSRSANTAIYVGDAVTFGRWLFDVGVRWERQITEEIEGRDLTDHQGVAPRLGVKYDATGDGTTLYSLFAGRYFEPFPQGFTDSFLRSDLFSGASLYVWQVGDPSCEGADAGDLGSPCWGFLESFEIEPFQEAELDPNLRRTRMDEWGLGFERRLSDTVSLQLHAISRRWDDFWDDVIFFDERADQVINVEQGERRHQAVRLLVQKRFADRWQMLASLTRSKTEGNLFSRRGDSTFLDFTDLSDGNVINRYGRAPYDRPNRLRIFGLYEIPLSSTVLTVGNALTYESGTPWQAERRDTQQGAIIFLDPRGSRRLDDVLQWDVSLTAAIETRSRLEILAKLEVFNLLDEQTQLGVEEDIDLPGFGLPRGLADLQEPRRLRFSIELRF